MPAGDRKHPQRPPASAAPQRRRSDLLYGSLPVLLALALLVGGALWLR